MKDERETIKDDGFYPIYPGMLVTWMRPEFTHDRVTRYAYSSRDARRGGELREMRPGTTEGTSEVIMVVIGIDDIESMQSDRAYAVLYDSRVYYIPQTWRHMLSVVPR